jgi:hypothetical protein
LGRWSSSFACRSEFLSSWDPLASSPASNDLKPTPKPPRLCVSFWSLSLHGRIDVTGLQAMWASRCKNLQNSLNGGYFGLIVTPFSFNPDWISSSSWDSQLSTIRLHLDTKMYWKLL